MNVLIDNLDGAALDFAVALAEGYKFGQPRPSAAVHLFPLSKPGWTTLGSVGFTVGAGFSENVPRFSTRWRHGGDIVEREKISISFIDVDDLAPGEPPWVASPPEDSDSLESWRRSGRGTTALAAAMRCYAKMRLGPRIEVPEVLL